MWKNQKLFNSEIFQSKKALCVLYVCIVHHSENGASPIRHHDNDINKKKLFYRESAHRDAGIRYTYLCIAQLHTLETSPWRYVRIAAVFDKMNCRMTITTWRKYKYRLNWIKLKIWIVPKIAFILLLTDGHKYDFLNSKSNWLRGIICYCIPSHQIKFEVAHPDHHKIIKSNIWKLKLKQKTPKKCKKNVNRKNRYNQM